jgi:glutathione peroxidase
VACRGSARRPRHAVDKWNFTKFLTADGKVIKRFAPNDPPEALKNDIEAALAA